MATKSGKKNCWGVEKISLLERYLNAKPGSGPRVDVTVTGSKKTSRALRVFESDEQVRIEVAPLSGGEREIDPALKTSLETRVRDSVGAAVAKMEALEAGVVNINFDLPAALIGAALTGLEIALYRFRKWTKGDEPKFKIHLLNKGKAIAIKAYGAEIALGQAVNLARHLTNLPPNWLNPVSYADFVAEYLGDLKGVKFEIWDEKRLHAENMHLHLDVGRGSGTPPRLVRIQYRGGGAGKAPIALVGKGVTFDSGGLDIKPSSAMRLMKKDMGGSAAVAGVAYWAAATKAKVNLDCYLALAENAISSTAFRPSDVITGRNGLQVEVHNTDAEGRLVLADAMDVAISQKPKPKVIVDVATLTGAIKASLGSQIAGLFSNDPALSKALHKAGQLSGDLNWPMPLFQKYRTLLSSNFADMINSPDGFGGAVTAALFLERFVGDVPWAHLDIYAWKDSPDGAILESGGSGQGVLCLTKWLKA